MSASIADGTADTSLPPIVVVDRLITLPSYRNQGFGKATLSECLLDITQMKMQAGVNVQRISIFIPRVPTCQFAAQTALRCGMSMRSNRATDPTNSILPEFFADAGLAEFSIDAGSLLEAFKSATASVTQTSA